MNKTDKKVIDFFENEITDPKLSEALKEYCLNRRELKKPLTLRAAKMALNKLFELAPGDIPKQTAIVRQSVFYGWIGLFPLKEINTSNYINKGTSTNQFLQMMKEAQNDKGGNY